MAGGFFNDSNEQGQITPVVPEDSSATSGTTSEGSPGGLFERGGTVEAGLPASVYEANAKTWAEIAAKWAVGPTDFAAEGYDGYSDTNNSKYWAEQSQDAASAASGYATAAENSATQAAASATAANGSATAAAASAASAATAQAAAEAAQAAAEAAETAAANSATAAATSASEASTSATNASNSASNAAASATAAATSATQAAASASAAATSATQAAASATAAATSASAAALSQTNAATSATAAAASASTAATDASEAEGYRDDARAYADADGPHAGVWASTDTLYAQHTLNNTPNGTHVLFDINGITGFNSTDTIRVYQNFDQVTRYTGSGVVPAGQYAISQLLNTVSVTFGTAPPTDDRLDIFIAETDEISLDESVPFKAQEAEYHVLTGTVQDATITLAAGTNLSGGGSFTVNQAANETITFNATGGGSNPPPPSERPTITLSATEVAEDSGAQSITGTIAVASGYTYDGTGTDEGSAGTDTIHATAGTITHSAVTANTFTWAFTAAQIQNPGTHTVTANVTATHDSVEYTHQASATYTVYRIWYTAVRTSIPTALSDMSSQGRFNNPETHTFTQNSSGTAEAYIALPTRSGGYYFGTGRNGIFNLEVTNHGVFGTDFTLYSFDLGDDDETYIVYISEA